MIVRKWILTVGSKLGLHGKPVEEVAPDYTLRIPSTKAGWDHLDKSLDLLLDRAKLREAELLKQSPTILARVGVGLAGVMTIAGWLVTARETLFRISPLSPVISWILIVVDILSLVLALTFLLLAAHHVQLKVCPDLTREANVNAILTTDLARNKAELIAMIAKESKENEAIILSRLRRLRAAYTMLAVALICVLGHTVFNSVNVLPAQPFRDLKDIGVQPDGRPIAQPTATPASSPSSPALNKPDSPAYDVKPSPRRAEAPVSLERNNHGSSGPR